MLTNRPITGHIAAMFTIFIWGTTFISTKILLVSFTPLEILFSRFIIGYLALWLVFPRNLILIEKKQERYFAGAGLCGITIYYLLENIALTRTLAINVGVIVSIAPFFTALFNCCFFQASKPQLRFFLGFAIAMAGILLVSFGNGETLRFNPQGDLLAVAAAIVWALYSVIIKKISYFGYPIIPATRRTFFYGLLFMLPALLLFDFHPNATAFFTGPNLFNLLFLGLGASALCFVTWNFTIRILGSVKTTAYIYLVPVVTTIASALILREPVTVATICGLLLAIIGLILSESSTHKNKQNTPITKL